MRNLKLLLLVLTAVFIVLSIFVGLPLWIAVACLGGAVATS